MLPPGSYSREEIYEFNGLPNSSLGEHPELLSPEIIRNWRRGSIEGNVVTDLKSLKGRNYVKLHLIPAKFPGSDVLLGLGTVSDPKNILKISEKKLNDPRLSQFRLDCYELWKPPTSLKIILAKAEKLRNNYRDLFN